MCKCYGRIFKSQLGMCQLLVRNTTAAGSKLLSKTVERKVGGRDVVAICEWYRVVPASGMIVTT